MLTQTARTDVAKARRRRGSDQKLRLGSGKPEAIRKCSPFGRRRHRSCKIPRSVSNGIVGTIAKPDDRRKDAGHGKLHALRADFARVDQSDRRSWRITVPIRRNAADNGELAWPFLTRRMTIGMDRSSARRASDMIPDEIHQRPSKSRQYPQKSSIHGTARFPLSAPLQTRVTAGFSFVSCLCTSCACRHPVAF